MSNLSVYLQRAELISRSHDRVTRQIVAGMLLWPLVAALGAMLASVSLALCVAVNAAGVAGFSLLCLAVSRSHGRRLAAILHGDHDALGQRR